MESPTNDPVKRALLIGIDTYPSSQFANLKGCVNDAASMREILVENYDFPEEHLTLLKNEEATREGILLALDDLRKSVTDEREIVVVMYAGHGSVIADREGDEPDGWDSTIVPYDSGRPAEDPNDLPNRDILDDEIYIWLQKIKSKYVTLIFDCCNSGTISRDESGQNDRWARGDTRKPEELPPSPISAEDRQFLEQRERDNMWLPDSNKYVLIAGCRVDQVAGEYKPPGTVTTQGLMSFFLHSELRKAQPGDTYRDIYERLVPSVLANRAQNPQIEGDLNRVVFGDQRIKPFDYEQISHRENDSVTVAAGAAKGVTEGSIWTIFTAGAKSFEDTAATVGQIEITEVRALDAQAKILEEKQPDSIVAACRAVETTPSLQNQELSVFVEAPQIYVDLENVLKDNIEQALTLRLTDSGDTAHVRIRLIGEGETVPGHPANRLPRHLPGSEEFDHPKPKYFAEKPSWIALDEGGLLTMPVHAIDEEPDPIDILIENLQIIAKKRRLLSITDRRKSENLEGKIKLILKQQDKDDAWTKAPSGKRGLPVFKNGEHLDIAVVNDFEKAVYFYLLIIGVDHSISMVYPPAGANESLAPGTSFDVGRQGYKTTLPISIPDTFVHNEGLDTLVLFATTQATDFTSLLAGAARSGDDNDYSSLAELVQQSQQGSSRKSTGSVVKTKASIPTDQWTAVKLSFYVVR